MKKLITKGLASIFTFCSLGIQAQDFNAEDYNKALWMTTRFYGAQRSGDNNWTIHNHLPNGVAEKYRGTSHIEDSDGNYDLSGGWNDCGDHVKFGQTQFYSGYMLLKAFYEFPTGFDDHYSQDYKGYNSSGKYDWEDGKGVPNGIPDLLDEVKHATDYFIKCAKNSNTFYYQVGNGGSGGTGGDHTHRVTSVLSQTMANNEGGQDRPIGKNPKGAAMASFCSSTLALMSRVYRRYDANYADLCLEHAKYAYDYAKSKKGQAAATAFGGFYGKNDSPNNAYAIMLSEMHWATGEASYKNSALAMTVGIGNYDVSPNEYYTFDYSNNGELALYVLSQLGHPDAKSAFTSHIGAKWYNNSNYNSEGIYKNGGEWGKLRYVGNAGFLMALYSKIKEKPLYGKVFDNIDYLMGSNNAKRSFIAGFETGNISSVKKPHHRNVYRNDEKLSSSNNSLAISDNGGRNFQFGALVGGALVSSSYSDKWNEYINTEVCIDYNAGLVGALGAIKSQVSPIDTNKFNAGTKPDLGEDVSICGLSSIQLKSNVAKDGVKTFTWYKNDVKVAGPSKNKNNHNATSGGTYRVVLDSLGEWESADEIVVNDVLPSINLGPDFELCTPSSKTLEAGINGNGVIFEWKKDGQLVSEESSLFVTDAGLYSLKVSAEGCNDQNDNVTVTSLLPSSVSGTVCTNPVQQTTIEVLAGHEEITWFDTDINGTELGTGSTLLVGNPGIYYAQDNSSFSANIGPTTTSGSGTNWGVKDYTDGFYLEFTTTTNFKIDALSLPYSQFYNNQTGVISIEVRNANGDLKGTFTSNEKSLTTNDKGLIKFNFTGFGIDASWGSDLRLSLNKNSTTIQGQLEWDKNGNFTYPYVDLSNSISITGSNANDQDGNNYVYFYDWEITSGNACARVPVKVTEDCLTNMKGFDSDGNAINPNPFTNSFSLITDTGNNKILVFDLSGKLIESYYSNGGTITYGNNLSKGVYLIKVVSDNKIKEYKIIKN